MIFSCFLVIPPSFQERRPYLFQLNECASLAWSMRRGRPYLSFISYPWYDRRNHHHYSEKAKSNTTVQRAVYSGPHGWRPSHGPPGIWPRTDIALNSLWNFYRPPQSTHNHNSFTMMVGGGDCSKISSPRTRQR